MPINLCHSQQVLGFQKVSKKYYGESAVFSLSRTNPGESASDHDHIEAAAQIFHPLILAPFLLD